ncbi:MAG: hypothetical protein WCD13_15325, partial [Pseudolabrys sp.]
GRVKSYGLTAFDVRYWHKADIGWRDAWSIQRVSKMEAFPAGASVWIGFLLPRLSRSQQSQTERPYWLKGCLESWDRSLSITAFNSSTVGRSLATLRLFAAFSLRC